MEISYIFKLLLKVEQREEGHQENSLSILLLVNTGKRGLWFSSLDSFENIGGPFFNCVKLKPLPVIKRSLDRKCVKKLLEC